MSAIEIEPGHVRQVCVAPGCSTLLSDYSVSHFCSVHERKHLRWDGFGDTGAERVEVVAYAVPRFPTVEPPERVEALAGAFLIDYANDGTRRAYQGDLRLWFEFCTEHMLDPLQVRRSHFSLFMRQREALGNSPATVNRKMTSLTSFYQWLMDEDYLTKNPAKAAKRPPVPQESSRDWLSGVELARCIKAAEIEGGYTYALICLLGYNALRISEVINANVADIGQERHNHTLRVMGKGSKPAVVVLNGPTRWAVTEALAGRSIGPLVLSAAGRRLTRDSAGRTCRRVAKHAGIKNKNITPHSFRHSAITAAHDDGADPRAVMEFARHAKLVTTQRYDRKRATLDEHLSYRLSGYIASRTDW